MVKITDILILDILTDWKYFSHSMNEEQFEKLLWNGFFWDDDDFLKEHISDYESFIKSDRWGIKFYRYIKKNLMKAGNINLEKIERAMNQFAKLNSF